MWSTYVALSKNKSLETTLIHSGQHDSLGLQARQVFNLIPDYVCDVILEDKLKLSDLVSKLISEFSKAFDELKPNLVLVHGDTTTAFSASVAAFLQNIPIGHIESGLRTSRFETPWPEEGYRRQISQITTLHFAPTSKSAENLYAFGINKGIYIVGNSVVDSLKYITKLPESREVKRIKTWVGNNQLVLVTCHRRESYGEPLKNLCNSIKTIVNLNPYVKIIWPIHPNSKIRDVVYGLEHDRILLIEPQDYNSFTKLLNISSLIITDSGGVIEEAAILGKSTLILRNETERPEALELDCIRLVGYNFIELEKLAKKWLENPPKQEKSNAFGDGQTGINIAEIINKYFTE